MVRKRFAALAAAGVAAVGALVATTTGTASATPPPASTVITDPGFGATSVAEGINVQATGGLLTLAPTLDTVCNGVTPRTTGDAVSLPIGTLLGALVLHGECNIAPRTDIADAKAKVASISLLNGAIKLVGIEAKCQTTKAGSSTCGSTVAELNGTPLALGPLSIVIPGVAAVYIDRNTETVNGDGSLVIGTVAAEVDLFPVVVAGQVVRAGETIIVCQATLTGRPD